MYTPLLSPNRQNNTPDFFTTSREPELDQSIPIHFSYVDLTQTDVERIEQIQNLLSNNIDTTEQQAPIIQCMTLKLDSSVDTIKIKRWLEEQTNVTALWSYQG